MLLIEATDKSTNKTVKITHEIRSHPVHPEHFIRVHASDITNPLGGKLLATYVLSAEAARELKAHL